MATRKMKHIPALSMNPMDTGDRYMIRNHRFTMAEKFGIARKEYPKLMEEQKQLLKMLKADDPEKYNKWFDIIVRGIEPEAEVVQKISEIPEEILQKINDMIDEYEGDALKAIATNVGAQQEQFISRIEKYTKETIDAESKKFNKIEYVVKSKGKKDVKVDAVLPEEFQDILDLASQRVNVMLVGPSGCGKTKISSVVAESLGLPFAAQSCSAGMSESIFSGWLLPVEANGQFTYVPSEFVKTYENGGVFLFDEIDGADSNTLLFLNQALANGEFYLPQRFNKPRIKKHKDFIAIAAANTFGNGATALYSGRNILDGATMDRFRMGIVPMDYSTTVEEKLIDPQILKWGRLVRNIIGEKSIRKIMSTRLLLDATKMKNAGWNLERIAQSYFSDWSREEKRMVEGNYSYSNFIRELENPKVVFEDAQKEEKPEAGWFKIDGDTFAHKDKIKSMGGFWDADEKVWKGKDSDFNLRQYAKLQGFTVIPSTTPSNIPEKFRAGA